MRALPYMHDEEGTRAQAAAALHVVSDELFELQHSMPEGTYVRLSAALKRAHEQI